MKIEGLQVSCTTEVALEQDGWSRFGAPRVGNSLLYRDMVILDESKSEVK